MKNLSSVQCGIKPLEGVLNRMVDGINARTPVAGAGILIRESDGSVVISATKKDDDKGQTGSQGGGQGQGGGGSLAGATSIRIYDVSFIDSAIVDPTTCQQTYVKVLIQDPGGWIDFNVYIGGNAPDTWVG